MSKCEAWPWRKRAVKHRPRSSKSAIIAEGRIDSVPMLLLEANSCALKASRILSRRRLYSRAALRGAAMLKLNHRVARGIIMAEAVERQKYQAASMPSMRRCPTIGTLGYRRQRIHRQARPYHLQLLSRLQKDHSIDDCAATSTPRRVACMSQMRNRCHHDARSAIARISR